MEVSVPRLLQQLLILSLRRLVVVMRKVVEVVRVAVMVINQIHKIKRNMLIVRVVNKLKEAIMQLLVQEV